MTFEHLWLLLLVFPPVLWTMFNSHRSHGSKRVLLKAFGTPILLLAFFLPGFFPRGSRAAATALADALAGLSGKELGARMRVHLMPKRRCVET
jgi:hypothetical protein